MLLLLLLRLLLALLLLLLLLLATLHVLACARLLLQIGRSVAMQLAGCGRRAAGGCLVARLLLVMLEGVRRLHVTLHDPGRQRRGSKHRGRGHGRLLLTLLLLLLLLLHRGRAGEGRLLRLGRHRQGAHRVVMRMQTRVVHGVHLVMGMMGPVIAAVTRVTAVQLDGRGGAVRGGRCLVVMLVIPVLQLMGLRVVEVVVATTGRGREEVGTRGRYVITLAVLLAGWELWVHHDRGGRQMVAGRCLLVLVVMISTAGGWIHQERAHFYFFFSILFHHSLFFLLFFFFFLFRPVNVTHFSLSLSFSRVGRGEKSSGDPPPFLEKLVRIHRRGGHGGSIFDGDIIHRVEKR